MPLTIGIDLGTTNTAVSYMKNGRPVMLQNEKGYTVFPSIVYWDKNGDVILGRRARSKMLTNPERGVFAVKRLMGLHHDSEEVSQIQKRIPYKILPSSDGMCLVEAAGQQFSPIDVAALILKEAKNIAEYALEEEVTGAVITVPAHFNHAQRDMTKRAAIQAGLHCELIINEPTAAALAYGFRQDTEKKVLVYDLGGGTFDVSILQFDIGVVETLATRGDTFLGGEDFDTRIINHIAEHFLAQSGVDLRDNPVASLRLKDAAEAAKCELSFKEKTKIYIPQIHDGQSIELMYTRAELEESTEDLIQKTLDVVRQTLEDSKTRVSQVDEVLLIGGQTRMPRIQQSISNLFNKKPSRGVNADEAVALGAGVRAGSMDDPSKAGPVLLDVTPFDLGIDISGGMFEKVILRNSKVPTSVTKTFSAVRHNQKVIRIVVRQGESRIATENEFLGEFRMSNLSRSGKGAISVDVTFEIDSSGMLKVRALEPHTGEAADITVRNYGEFTQGSGVSLSVEQRAHKGKSPAASKVDDIFEEETASPKAANEEIEKKVGFFGRLFGSKKKQTGNRLELEEVSEEISEEEVIPVQEVAIEELSEDDLLLEDIFEEKPAQQGLANSSFAVEGQELEEAEVTFVEAVEEEEDVSSYLATQEDTVTELELDDLLLELEEDSDETLVTEDIEETLDDLLEDLDATIMMERPNPSQAELPTSKEEAVEELDLDFLEEFEEQNEDSTAKAESVSAEEVTISSTTEEVLEELDLSFIEEAEDDGQEQPQEEVVEVEVTESDAGEELDLSFLEDDDLIGEEEVKEESIQEEALEELDLSFIEDEEEQVLQDKEDSEDELPGDELVVETQEEAVEELDLKELETAEVQDTETVQAEDIQVEEIDLSFLEAEVPTKEDETKEEQHEHEEVEEVDLGFLDEVAVKTDATPTSDADDVVDEDIDISALAEESKEEVVVSTEVKESTRLTLRSEESPESVPKRNEVIQSFLAANVEKADVFSIQDDGFFTEESPSKRDVSPQEDEEIAIPTAEDVEEDIDLDFFEDLFDD